VKPTNRIQSLEVLRGLAALAVAWFHITHGGELLADAANPLLQAVGVLRSD
jgi:peptidoglycan/LPS O-acetylase OafA/YrhL